MVAFLNRSCLVESKYNFIYSYDFSKSYLSFKLCPLRMKGQDTCPQMTLGPWNFFRNCPGTYKGHVLVMSHVLICVLKISRGWDGSLLTKAINATRWEKSSIIWISQLLGHSFLGSKCYLTRETSPVGQNVIQLESSTKASQKNNVSTSSYLPMHIMAIISFFILIYTREEMLRMYLSILTTHKAVVNAMILTLFQ